jgi:alkylation response protein AidB-like acyl-CoA dehydrogenase
MLALLTAEQRMFKQAVTDLAAAAGLVNPADLGTIDTGRAWRDIAAAGLLGLRVREDGRPVATGTEVILAAAALAGRLVPLPVLGSGILALELLALARAPHDWIGELAAGRARYAVLLSPDLSRPADLDDTVAVAWDSAAADYLLVLDRSGGAVRVSRAAAAGQLSRLDSIDLTREAGQVSEPGGLVTEPAGQLLGPSGLDRWLALALTTVSADIVGAMRGALDGVVGYAKQRVQFGVPVGSFQAVQHLCAEALVKVEAADSVTKYAAWAVDELDPADALLAARTAKAYASSVARDVPETVMQVYGGIGQTWENIAHFYLRRALLDRQVLGTEQAQLARIADRRLGA